MCVCSVRACVRACVFARVSAIVRKEWGAYFVYLQVICFYQEGFLLRFIEVKCVDRIPEKPTKTIQYLAWKIAEEERKSPYPF